MSTSYESSTMTELNKAREKLLRAKRRNAEFSQAEQDIDKQQERLEEQKRCLVTKRLMLHGQYKDWLDNTITRRTIIPYCKAWNRNFAVQLQTRLPREIRDMIYKHLWYFDPDRTSNHLMARSHVLQHYTFTCAFCDPDTIATFPGLIDIVQSLLKVKHGNLRQLFDKSALPHYLSSDYVGVLIAHEVGVSFYLSLCAENLLQCKSTLIRPVLKEDVFHLGLHTMDLITSLTVHCKIDRYRTAPPDHKLSSKCNHSLKETAQIRKDELKQDFSVLLDIKKKKGFRLHIIMHQRNIRLAVLEEAMDTLQEVFRQFQLNDASLTVTWTYRGHWKNEMGPPCPQLVTCDITPESETPKDPLVDPEWLEDLLEVLEEAQEIILPQHSRFYNEPANNVEALDRKGINMFVHSMYDTDEEAGNTDSEDNLSEFDEDWEDDHDCALCFHGDYDEL